MYSEDGLARATGVQAVGAKGNTRDSVISPWIFLLIVLLSVAYYLIYHQLPNLHDIAHYIVAGVSMVRDHHALIYPYAPMDPSPGWSAYNYFQDNSRLVPLYKTYPSQLYSALFGIYYVFTGSVSFAFGQILSMLAFGAANALLYLVGVKFFGRAIGLLFILAVVFVPVMRAVLYPSNDAFAYLFCAILLWGCLVAKIRPFLIGAIVGLAGHFRAQAWELIAVAPLLFIAERRAVDLWSTLARYIAGVLGAYLLVSEFLNLWQGGRHATDGAGIDFYIEYFRSALPGAGLWTVVRRLLHNTMALVDSGFLFFLVFTTFGCLVSRAPLIAKALAGGGLVIVTVPLVLYSVDPFSNPHPRYYVMAVPLLVLAWFRWMVPGNASQVSGERVCAIVFTTVLSGMAWVHLYGTSVTAVASWSSVRDRIAYPNLPGFGENLTGSFSKDDLLVTNHALASVLTPARNFIPYPSFSDFASGDNREIDGLFFVFGNYVPDNFFEPRDWMKGNDFPLTIRDKNGTEFGLVSRKFLHTPDFRHGSDNKIQVVVYKNSHPAVHDHVEGKRVYHVEHLIPGLTGRSKDPTFTGSDVWAGALERAPSGGVIVGPGSRSSNVLNQQISVRPGERLVLSVVASAHDMPRAHGRLQINWFNAHHQFLSADIARFKATDVTKQYQRKVTVPTEARKAAIVVTPDGDSDMLRFTRAEILGDRSKDNVSGPLWLGQGKAEASPDVPIDN